MPKERVKNIFRKESTNKSRVDKPYLNSITYLKPNFAHSTEYNLLINCLLILEITHLDSLIELGHSILVRLRQLVRNKALENLIAFETLPEQYQMSAVVLWDCLLALKIKPHKLDGRIYFTAGDLKRVEQFIKRIEISWDCPDILETCYPTAKISSSSLILWD